MFVSAGEKDSEDQEEKTDHHVLSAIHQPSTPGSPSENIPSDLSDSSPSETESEKHGTPNTFYLIN